MIEAWTDGAASPNPGKGGFAAIVRLADGTEHEIIGSDPHTTNNRMEMLAVIAALEYASATEPMIIYSDSQYVVQGRTWAVGWRKKGWRTSKKEPVLNRDLWEQLLAMCEHRRVELCWVRGHNGHPMNERCDMLAQAAIP